MLLQPQTVPPIPKETARVACAAFPKGNRCMRMRDDLGAFFNDQDLVQRLTTRLNRTGCLLSNGSIW